VANRELLKSFGHGRAARKGSVLDPAVGIGFRAEIRDWTLDHLDQFDVLEVTVDHCIFGRPSVRDTLFGLAHEIPISAHGVGLSIGTDVPLDMEYLDRVADIVARLKSPSFSEHLAFTKVPGFDLANLLPIPRTEAVAEKIIEKVRIVQNHVKVPFQLENISYVFDWPEPEMSEVVFFNLIREETGVGLLLDVENLYVNSRNHDFDPYAYLDALPPNSVAGVHAAGGVTVSEPYLDRPIFADSHSHPVPDEALNLLTYTLDRQAPDTVILERDDRLQETGQILDDVRRLRDTIARRRKVG
jgi:uncharacterized protein (UPF0276 family)